MIYKKILNDLYIKSYYKISRVLTPKPVVCFKEKDETGKLSYFKPKKTRQLAVGHRNRVYCTNVHKKYCVNFALTMQLQRVGRIECWIVSPSCPPISAPKERLGTHALNFP